MVERNTTTAKESNNRIRGMTQEKRLQEFNLLHAALGKGDKREDYLQIVQGCKGREDLGSPDLAVGK